MAIVPITIRGELEFRRQLLSKAKADGTSLQAVITHCLEDWLSGGRVVRRDEPAHPEVPRERRVYIDRLAKILASGDTPAIKAAMASIDLLLDRLQSPPAVTVHDKRPHKRVASE